MIMTLTKLATGILLSVSWQASGMTSSPSFAPTLSQASVNPTSRSASIPTGTVAPGPSPSLMPSSGISFTDLPIQGTLLSHTIVQWSILLPLMAITAAVWTWRKSTRRFLCILPTFDDEGTVPEEIFIEQNGEEEDFSVVGDRYTDVGLVPVHTWRSHEWKELGQDIMHGIGRSPSDYLGRCSEALADYVVMNDECYCISLKSN